MNDDVFDDPEGSREEILAATYRSLYEHGYSNLTIQRIGEEFDKSTSLLYYHYENKDELVLATLEYLLAAFEEEFTNTEITDPGEDIETFLDRVFEAPAQQTHIETLLELRIRATHDEAYQRHFVRSDRVFEEYISQVVRAGIESGEFRDVDPDAVATTVVTLVNGVLLRRSTDDGDAWLERARAELEAYLEHRLNTDSAR